MSLTLDDFLSNTDWSKINRKRKLLSTLREAYTCGVPAMVTKSLTDRLKVAGKYKFYLGTPPDILRRIASFLITEYNYKPKIIINLLPALWKRHGKEDAILYGIILANINPKLLDENIWIFFSKSLRIQEPADDIMSVCEELIRATHSIPSEEILQKIFQKGLIHQQLVLFILFQKYKKNTKLTKKELMMVEKCKGDNDLILKIKAKILNN